MKINNNSWNKIRYTLYLPVYDLIAGFFSKQRQKSINLLQTNRTDKILLLGAGTGLDLDYLVGYSNISAIDITPGMIEKLRHKAAKLGIEIDARVMDGHLLDYEDESFDAVILHLIIAVIPDPYKCIKEVERVLKPGGKVMIFDKFLPDNTEPSLLRKLLNKLTSSVFSDINRRVGDIISKTGFMKELDVESGIKAFRIIRLKKPF